MSTHTAPGPDDAGGDQRTAEQLRELEQEPAVHRVPAPVRAEPLVPGIYLASDHLAMSNGSPPRSSYVQGIRSIDELLERDRQREQDGFPRKVRVGRLIKPGRGGKDKVVVVPTTVEEKLLHDRSFKQPKGGGTSGGSGDGEEGEVIGEQPVHTPDAPGAGGAGQGEDGPHEVESSAYDLGKILTEKFELPNLKDKGKKRFLTRYTYDLTDRHRGSGQVLDKKATLRRILETNLHLGNVPDVTNIDATGLLVAPNDLVFRILSPEKDYESQAMIFFIRDYSGSMSGRPTELVVSQHVLIYAWLLYQYARQVETVFVLHDTEAREVPDFYTYYSSTVAGGTRIASAYRLVNRMVREGSLDRDYNIYIFQGTDGDDWDAEGKEALPELETMLGYANRIGITVARRRSAMGSMPTAVETYLKQSQLLEQQKDKLRLDVIPEDADEPRLIEGIRTIISLAGQGSATAPER